MSLLFGERSLHKVAGIYDHPEEVREVVEEIVHEGGINIEKIQVVGPDDPAISRKLEPEEVSMAQTMSSAHIILGVVGMLVGLLIAGLLLLFGVNFAIASPYYTVFLGVGFGTVLGLLFGGLVTLRPDQDAMNTRVEEATHEGHWAVVVHATNVQEMNRAEEVINHSHGRMVHTF